MITAIVILIAITVIIIAVVAVICKKSSIPCSGTTKCTTGMAACTTGMLSGEVLDIFEDEDTGLTCIIVQSERGPMYGFSKLPANQLKSLYMDKGSVEIPVSLPA